MRRMGVISGHLMSTCFCGSIGCRRDPRVLGRHNCDILLLVILEFCNDISILGRDIV